MESKLMLDNYSEEELLLVDAMTDEELLDAACNGNELAQSFVTLGSSRYAQMITHVAYIERIMTQKFAVLVKREPLQLIASYRDKLLEDGSSLALFALQHIAGKQLVVEVDWYRTLNEGQVDNPYLRAIPTKERPYLADIHLRFSDVVSLQQAYRMRRLCGRLTKLLKFNVPF